MRPLIQATDPALVTLFRKAFGSDCAAVVSAVPELREVDGHGEQLCYWLDLTTMSTRQLERLIDWRQADQRNLENLDRAAIALEIATKGFPVMARGTRCFNSR